MRKFPENKQAAEVFEEGRRCRVSICFPLLGTETPRPLLIKMTKVDEKSQKHENKINVQDVGEVDGGADDFRQRNAEEFGLVEDGNGLYDRDSFS